MSDIKDQFPDLTKAANAKSLADLIDATGSKQLFTPAEKERSAQAKTYKDDFCTLIKSQGTAIDVGNKIAYQSKLQADKQAKGQLINNAKSNAVTTVKPGKRRIYGKRPNQIALPPTKNAGSGRNPKPKSISTVRYGHDGDTPPTYSIPQLGKQTQIDPKRQTQQYRRFVAAQAGQRGTQDGDRVVVYSHNGSPLYGDEVLRQSDKNNLSANLATATPPVTQPPGKINLSPPIKGSLDRQARGQGKPKSNTVGNMAVLLGIAAAVSAVMFALQYVVQIISFIFNIQSLLNQTTNAAKSFLNLFNNIGALLGMGEDVTKPIGDTVDGILNNSFGKENVQDAKIQAAKINTIYNAGINIMDRVRSSSQTLGDALARSSNNTSRIGNLLMSGGWIDKKAQPFEENIQVKINQPGKVGSVVSALGTVSELTDDLTSITEEIKTGKEQLESLDKQAAEQQQNNDKSSIEGQQEARSKYFDADIPRIANFKRSDI